MVAIFIYTAYLKKKKSTAKDVMDNAENQVEQIKKEKLFKFREEMQQKRLKFQEEFKQKENQLSRNESKILGKEKELRRLENNLKFRESRLGQRNKKILQREGDAMEGSQALTPSRRSVGLFGGSQGFLPRYGDESVEPRLEGLESL